MKKPRNQKRQNFLSAVIFFIMIAIIMQIAILIYDFIRQKTDDLNLVALLILLLIFVLSVVATVVDIIRRKIMVDKPADKILSATERIAKGDFSVNLNIPHSYTHFNNYDLIMENINRMTDELKKHEVLKTDFISNVSHELKTPIAVIKNYATALKDDSLDQETKKKYLDGLLLATSRLSDLVSNILKLNKLENQEISVETHKFNLTTSLGEAVLNFESRIENKNISLDCDFDDVIIDSSETILELVWNNLISNAVKFTNDGGKISVSLKKQGDSATVTVTDNGCGISAETGARIFEKFYQGDASHATEGNGLGLALVKRVIDLLGGRIKVESKLGEGASFSITLKGVVNDKL